MIYLFVLDVELLAGPGGRMCGTLADIRLFGMTGWELFRAISCHSFWRTAARGETRESILAPSTPGRLGYLAVEAVDGAGRFCFSECFINFYKYLNILQSGPADRWLAH